MTDIVPRHVRSKMMASIRGRDTKPELLVRKALHRAGYRFRLHEKALPGRPDIVMKKHEVAIFVQGCFWHRHIGCHYCTTPATNQDFWKLKFKSNVRRDRRDQLALIAAGWRVAIIWECVLKGSEADREKFARSLSKWIISRQQLGEFAAPRVRRATIRGSGRGIPR